MIIKSIGRKAGKVGLGAKGSPFAKLVRYMNRGIQEEQGRAVLWHNFYGHEGIAEQDIIDTFEGNARYLQDRKNGNVLYHEILSFETIEGIAESKLETVIADIGQAYLDERATNQLGYGVIHKETDHIHLHLMLSANAIEKGERVRLSKKDFADIQKSIEAMTLARYPELNQSRIYDKAEQNKDKLKTQNHEQAMKSRTGKASRKETIKSQLHQMFERAGSFEELAQLFQSAGFSIYQRGKTVGVEVTEPDGTTRRLRFNTLGVAEHYQATNERLFALQQSKPHEPQKSNRQAEPTPAPTAEPKPKPQAEPIREQVPNQKTEPAQEAETETARRIRELQDAKQRARDRDEPDRER